ncbi:MAG: hypothetical protein ROO76_13755 [Terriglobia bacterium]|nr:hypothetical protein [Terriglobia bacterium]
MSRLFESFEYLNRGWDARALENISLRKAFLFVVVFLFVLGMAFGMTLFAVLRLHHFDVLHTLANLVYLFIAYRYVRLIYRRLGQESAATG